MTTPLSHSMAGAIQTTGLSRSTLERAIRSGRLRAKKSDTDAEGNPCGVWVIKHEALTAFVDGLVDA